MSEYGFWRGDVKAAALLAGIVGLVAGYGFGHSFATEQMEEEIRERGGYVQEAETLTLCREIGSRKAFDFENGLSLEEQYISRDEQAERCFQLFATNSARETRALIESVGN